MFPWAIGVEYSRIGTNWPAKRRKCKYLFTLKIGTDKLDQTVSTQIRRCVLRRRIWGNTICHSSICSNTHLQVVKWICSFFLKNGNELRVPNTCCPFDISRKDVFCLAFSLKWKYFVLIDHILSEIICLFCFCVLFSNIYPKIKFIAKNWSDPCNFYSKVIFWNFCLRKYFYFSLLNLNYWYFTTILWKFQNSPSYLPYKFLHNL